jgi:DNA-binding PadR family transcriptional regulator
LTVCATKTLVRDGHVVRSHVAQSDRPDKTLYRLTREGAAELMNWATSPHVRSGGFRDELFLKLLAASRLGTDTLTAFVTAQRQTLLADLAGLTRLRRESATDPLVALLIDAAIAHIKADLQVIEAAEQRLAPLAEQASGTIAAEDAEPPTASTDTLHRAAPDQ